MSDERQWDKGGLSTGQPADSTSVYVQRPNSWAKAVVTVAEPLTREQLERSGFCPAAAIDVLFPKDPE